MTPGERLVMLTLDAAEPLLLTEGMQAGWLPHLARFFAAGSCVRLFPVDDAFPGAAWPTLITGAPLIDHRVLRDRRLAPHSYAIEDVPASAIARPPFWRYVSDGGLRTTAANLYGAPLLDHFLGTQVQGWASMDPYTSKFGRPLVDPPGTLEWLERDAGRPKTAYELKMPRAPAELRRYRDDRVEDIRIRTRAYGLLLERTDWNLYFVSFPEIHQAGHVLWHVHDPEHPEHDPETPADLLDALRDLYREVDDAVGELLGRVPAGATVFLLTPHGMGPNHLIGDPGEAVLARAGLFTRHRDGADGHGGGRARMKDASWQLARRIVPERARLALRRRVADQGWVASMALAGIDWDATRAFTVPPDMGTYVRLNVRGREPAGTVEPGDEYEALTREIAATFQELVFADTGRPAVDRVLLPEDIGGREAPDGLPDVLVVWSRAQRGERLRSERLGEIEVPHDDPRTGQHRPMGFVVGTGPGIAAEGSTAFDGPSATLLDVAPTALARLGVPVPAAVRGEPIAALLGS